MALAKDKPPLPENNNKHITFMKYKPRLQWEHLAAGVSGGVISTLVLHPLDLIKVRFQVNEGAAVSPGVARPQYKGIFDALVTIGKTEGLRGLYQGVTPNIWGAGASWGLYFLFYNSLKSYVQRKNDLVVLGPGQHMLAAAEAGVLTLAITNPIWVTKTRLCLQYDQATSTQYRGMFDCLTKIYKHEGFRGLYKGFIPGVFGVSHGALQFMAYEELKKLYNGYRKRPLDSKFNSLEYIVFAALSKIFAASSTYPYQVVRSRLQDQHRVYNSLSDVIKQIWRNEGTYGFYKGLGTSLLRVTPACCITFVVYEKMTSLLMPPKNKTATV